MTIKELEQELAAVIQNEIPDPLLIMGESGIGKTAVVNRVANQFTLKVWDVRWGQLMPADARGVPVADRERKTTQFYPPEFWPRQGPGIIFLDEYNMAAASMMGLGQQLLLDKRFGDYVVPPGIFVWAAGNRKIDRAIVNEIPGPTNNRLAHYTVEHDFETWELWSHEVKIDELIVGFLKWRQELLHKFDPTSSAWPSPRTWEMADRRFKKKMSIAPVVGEPASDEFLAYKVMLKDLPNLEAIESGRAGPIPFPDEPSVKYATISALTRRSLWNFPKFQNSFRWLSEKVGDDPDWVSMFVQDFIRIQKSMDPSKARGFLAPILEMPELGRFVAANTGV